jgi:hypothetical protein
VALELGIGEPEREPFALLHGLLFGGIMLVGIPRVGRILGESPRCLAGARSHGAIRVRRRDELGGLRGRLIRQLRDGPYPAGDLVSPATTLLASTRTGAWLAAHRVARIGWSWITGAAAAILLVIVR